jgi:hypothetical protein
MAALIGADMAKIRPVLEEISHGDYVVVPANLNFRSRWYSPVTWMH